MESGARVVEWDLVKDLKREALAHAWVQPFAGTTGNVHKVVAQLGDSVEQRLAMLRMAVRMALEELMGQPWEGSSWLAALNAVVGASALDTLVWALALAVSQPQDGHSRPTVAAASAKADEIVASVFDAWQSREHSLGRGVGQTSDIQDTVNTAVRTGTTAEDELKDVSPEPSGDEVDKVTAELKRSMERFVDVVSLKRVQPKRSAEKKCEGCGNALLKCSCEFEVRKARKPPRAPPKPAGKVSVADAADLTAPKNMWSPVGASDSSDNDEPTGVKKKTPKLVFDALDPFPRKVLQSPHVWPLWLQSGAKFAELKQALEEVYLHPVCAKDHPVLFENHHTLIASILASVRAGGSYTKAVFPLIKRLEDGLVYLICPDPQTLTEYRARVGAQEMAFPFQSGWSVVHRKLRNQGTQKQSAYKRNNFSVLRSPVQTHLRGQGRSRGAFVDPTVWASMTDEQRQQVYAGRKGR